MKPILYIVVPCYNEEAVLPITAPLFLNKLNSLSQAGKISENSRVMFVNDGSRDKTWEIISDLAQKDPRYIGVCLSRNQGHQKALLAGLMSAKDECDITISIDCDGQDDIDAMDKMVDEYLDGAEIVYGVRSDRKKDSFMKRTSAQGFYKFMKFMGGEVVYNHADYRLMSSKALEALSQFEEYHVFLRGMVPLVGFKSTSVYYERHLRMAGKSHYPLKRMLSLAMDGITGLSTKPIRMITWLGFIVAAISFIGIIWSLIELIIGNTVAGWTSTVSIICLLGGIQLIGIGVIGEYVGKIFMETKKRPRYIIEKRTDKDI